MHKTTENISSSAPGATPAAKPDHSGFEAEKASGKMQTAPAMEAGNRQNGPATDIWYKRSFDMTNRQSLQNLFF